LYKSLGNNSNNFDCLVTTPARLLAEIEEVYTSDSNGVILFDLEGINEAGLTGLANGPFSMPVTRDTQ
jgi:hypothetical protein